MASQSGPSNGRRQQTTNSSPRSPASPASPSESSRPSTTSRRPVLDLGDKFAENGSKGGKNRGGTDLASLLVNAQRRKADQQRKAQGDKPKPSAKQNPPPATPNKPEPSPPREIPKASTPAARTIHAALGVSRRKQPNTPKRVDKTTPDAEFRRTLPQHPAGVIDLNNSNNGPSSTVATPRRSSTTHSPPRPAPRKLFDPKQHDAATFRPPRRASASGKQLFDPKAPAHRASPPPSKPPPANQRSMSPLPSLSMPGSMDNTRYATDALKQAYRDIQELEEECLSEAEQEKRRLEDGNFGRNKSRSASHLLEGLEDPNAYWIAQVRKHKKLAEAHHHFLFLASEPSLPPALQAMPQKQKTTLRLWQNAIHLLLERLRHAISDAPDMTELLLEFLHYSYSFYTCLLDEHGLFNHKVVWLESLGDLARYRMAVAHLLNRQASLSSPSPQTLSSSAIERINQTAPEPQARIDDEGQADWGDEASVGMAALDDIETDEVEIWKRSALEWYSYALMEAPENGRIHHHLALLHKGDDLKSLYHFCKSLSAASPHLASNESILAMFDSEDQARRISPEADSTSLFVYLQGLLFTRVSLDRFNETLDRFLEQIERQHFPEEPKSHPSEPLKQLTSVRWMMIATIAVSAMTVFGKLESSLAQALKHGRSAERERRTRNTSSSTPHTILSNPTSKADKAEDEAESDTSVDVSDDASQPMQQLRLDDNTRHKPPHNDADAVRHSAQRLAFRLLGLLAKHPTLTYAAELNTINPCIVVLLTFLSRLFACAFKQTFALVERDLPWPELVHLFNQIPADVVLRHDPPAKVIGAPLPEDWCLRGMDWTERGLYSRGFWKSRSHATTPDSEFAVLESEAEEHFAALLHIQIRQSDSDEGVASGRWKRVASAGSVFVRHVPGLTLELDNAQGRKFKMSSVFSSKVAIWKKEDVAEVQQRKVHQITASAGANGVEEILVTDESEGEGDGPLLHSIKARRRLLRECIRQSRALTSRRSSSAAHDAKSSKAPIPVRSRPNLRLWPGYTILIVDSTILLRGRPLLESLLDDRRFTVVVPLAVVSDLDVKQGQGDTAAVDALSFLETSVPAHALYLKVQTSKGNYLQDLRFRSEDHTGQQRHDTITLVLQVAQWHLDHFVNRTNLINPTASEAPPQDALKVALLTLNQKFRQKARSSKIEALNDSELLDLVAKLPDG